MLRRPDNLICFSDGLLHRCSHAKGRNKHYPYYECFKKGCEERRKSIRKDVLESEFEAIIKRMRPSAGIMSTVAAMFRDIWDNRIQRLDEQWKEQKQAIKGIDTKIGRLTDRLIDTDNVSAIKAYEVKLDKLESQKALINENLAKKLDLNQDFDKSFRTALVFLANPWNLWASPNLDHRKTLIKLVFAAPLPYARNQGFRTAKTTSPFKVLAALGDEKKEMAVDAVPSEPVSAVYGGLEGINRENRVYLMDPAIGIQICRVISEACRRFPCSELTGNLFLRIRELWPPEQGKRLTKQGNKPQIREFRECWQV